MVLLRKVIGILFGLPNGSWIREREQFFRDEIIKAYDTHDYERAEFLIHLREDLLG